MTPSVALALGAPAFELDAPARARFTVGIEALAGVLGMGRVRAVVRNIFPGNPSETEVRRRLGNPVLASGELVAALGAASTRGRALAVIAHMTVEAWNSPAVDDRVRVAFIRASDALRAADMPRYRKDVAALDELAARLPSEILDSRALLLAFASRNGERLLHALANREIVAEEHEGLQAPSAGGAGALTAPAPPTIATDQAPAPPPPPLVDTPAPPSAPVVAPPVAAPLPATSTATPVTTSTIDRTPATLRPAPSTPRTSAVRSIIDALRQHLTTLLVEGLATPVSATDVLGLWEPSVRNALAEVEAGASASSVATGLRRLAEAADQAASAVTTKIADGEARRSAAARALSTECGEQTPEEVLRDLDALASEAEQLPEGAPEEALASALGAAGPVPARVAAYGAALKAWRDEADKRLRIEALRRELAELEGQHDTARPSSAEPPPPQLAVPQPAPQPALSPPAAPSPGIAFATATGFPHSFPRNAFLSTIKTGSARAATRVLPLEPDAGVIPAKALPAERVTAAAAWVVRVCREDVVLGNAPLSFYLTVLDDVSLLLRDTHDPAAFALVVAVSGLLLLPASDYPPRARRRFADAIVLSPDEPTLIRAFLDVLAGANQPALTLVLSRLLVLGHREIVLALTVRLAEARPALSRGWAEALGVALATLSPAARDEFVVLARKHANLGEGEADAIERWLDNVGPRRTAKPLEVDRPAWLVDTLGRYAQCEYETSDRGDASVNAAVPVRVRDAGVYVAPGAEKAVLPVLVRNSGQRAAAAVEVRLQTTASSGCTLPSGSTHAYVPWIGREGLEPPHDAIFEVQVDIPPDTRPRELKLNGYVRWAGMGGKEVSKDLVYIVTTEAPMPASANVPAEGVRGSPLDLNDPKVLERSSRTVRTCLNTLTTKLRRGDSVRAMVYGRRRRGKSSIRRTLASDPAITRHFVVRESTWNSAAMSTVRFGLEHLAGLIRDALLDRAEDVRAFEPREGASREELSAGWQVWLRETAARLNAPSRVLLLLDEFQKWVSGLQDPLDRLVLLNAFRAFNDASGSRLDVSFVLFGLQNLLRFHRESIDFRAAVEAYEIRPFTLEESKRYVQECLPQAHDDRVRRRLHELSGGNPFVLNIFCQQLAARANQANRGYCLPGDVESLLDGLVDDRVEAVFAYMLREDEEENAPSLIQLSTLRAVAGRLHETGSHDGWVRLEGVEDWLLRKSVPFDPGLPQEQLLQLHELGILERHQDGRRFALPGEAICRWLAGQDESRVPLLPVTHRRDSTLVLNRYRQLRQIATGGQATTWLAENVEGGHKVVLKIYQNLGGEARDHVAREGEMLGRVRSPYVITCHSHAVDERKGGVLVLEWVDGHSLGELLRERPASAISILPGGQLAAQVELMKKLATGVAAVHEARVVHKDLKPSNIMLVEASGVFVPKLIDFGIASDEPGSVPDGATRSAFTWRYLAPEKRKDQTLARGRPADIYSLGVVFLDLLTGDCKENAEVLVNHVPAGTPTKLAGLIGDMIADDPARRPSAQSVLSRLEGLFEPGGWLELVERAEKTYVDGRHDESATYYERALGEVPSGERAGEKFATVVGDLIAVLVEGSCVVQWWGTLVDAVLDALSSSHASANLAAEALKALAVGSGDTTTAPRWEILFDALERRPLMRGGWVPLLAPILEDATLARHHGDRLFELCIRFREANLLSTAPIANFCAVAAEAHRRSASSTAVVETWLRRGKRVHGQPTDALAAELEAFAELLQRTQAKASLPPNCENQDRTVIGSAEKGHLDVDRIERFANRLLEMHPYVCAVKRRRKDGDLAVSTPRLLDDANLAQHRIDGIDDNCIIPFVLDGSFSAEGVPIRMNIVLPKGTTAPQRKVARDAIAANTQLFG